MIDHDSLLERVYYDPETGIFTWLAHSDNPASKIGKVAGNVTAKGYITIQIDGVQKQAHCWAWYYMTGTWPKTDIDHRDRDGLNNRWANLRLATRSQNNQNQGVTGLNYIKRDKYWAVRLKKDGKSVSGGGSRCFGKALIKRVELKLRLHPDSPECAGLRDKMREWKLAQSVG